MNKLLQHIYYPLREIKNNRIYKSLGIKGSEIKRIKRGIGDKRTSLFGVNIEITNFFWYLHSLNELFLDKTYAFNSDKKEPYILDCGANIGLSVIFFKKNFPNAKITAFEADPAIANVLARNLQAFGYDDVAIIPKAVWINDATLSFESDGSLGGHIVETSEKNTIRNQIQAIRLKDYLNDEIDFLKIDIEGVEYEVLIDCQQELNNVKNLFIEYHSFLQNEQKLDEILLLLKKAGFRYYIKEAWNNMPFPFIDNRKSHYDLQLNIFAYRL